MREAIERQRDLLEPLREVTADERRELRARDVLVVTSHGLRRRREDGLVQAGRLLQPPRQTLAGDRAVLPVLGPGRPGDVAAGDALDVDPLTPAHVHGAAVEVGLRAERLRKLRDLGLDE